MDKLKKVFSPGASKDDEIMYGDAEARHASVAAGKQPEQNTDALHPVEGLEQKEKGGVLRQVLNPDNAKHDELRYGTTATTEEPERPDPNKLQTDEGQKDHTVIGQILNPGGKKYDEQRHGTTAATEGDRRSSVPIVEPEIADPNTTLETDPEKKDQSILKQIFNPGRKKHDEAAHSGKTAQEAGESSSTQTPVKDNSVTRQTLNPGGEEHDPLVHGTPQTTTGAAESSNLGRDTAIGAGAVAAGGGAAYAVTRDKKEPSEPLQNKSTTGFSCDRAKTGPAPTTFATQTRDTSNLQDKSATGFGHDSSDERTATNTAPAVSQSGQAPASCERDTTDSHFGRDAAIVGAGTAAVGAGGYVAHQHKKRDEDNKASSTLNNKPQTDELADGRTSTQAAEEGSGSHSYGRDAAVASGAGVLGASSAHVATKDHDNDVKKGDTILAATGTAPVEKPFEEGVSSHQSSGGTHINPIGAPIEPAPSDHHYTRDAAIAGGVLGAGQDRNSAPEQINIAPADVQAATYTYSSQPVGGTSEDISRPLAAPHVPGEFPLETGEDPHETSKNFGSTVGDSQVAPLAGSEDSWGKNVAARAIGSDTTQNTAPHQTGNETRDIKPEGHGKSTAAGVAGVGLATAGAATAYNASKSTEASSSTKPSSTAASIHQGAQGYPIVTTTDTKQSAPSDTEHHGRDAAVVGGLGAAGAGTAYAATRDHDQPLPASQQTATQTTTQTTTQQPTTTKTSTYDAAHVDQTSSAPKTSGPHSSDIANKADPRVVSDPAKQAAQKATKDHDYETRDAALASGVAGAGAGAAAYGTTHETYGEDDPHKHNKLHKPSPDEKKAEKEAEKEHKKAEKEAEKEHKKAEKEAEKEHKKAEKQAEKDQKKAEKEAEKESKPSLLDRILHPGHHSEDKESRKSSDDASRGRETQPTAAYTPTEQHHQPHPTGLAEASDSSGRVIEPHTGLPMNVEKYGTGAGGTDGAKQIEGYHEQDSSLQAASIDPGQGAGPKTGHAQPGEAGVAGLDGDVIRKSNTPY